MGWYGVWCFSRVFIYVPTVDTGLDGEGRPEWLSSQEVVYTLTLFSSFCYTVLSPHRPKYSSEACRAYSRCW